MTLAWISVRVHESGGCWQKSSTVPPGSMTLKGLGCAGLAMDIAFFDGNGDLQPNKGPSNILRPEAAESLFYMWRVTGETKYREWGWRMFQAFVKHSRTKEGAFAAVKVVRCSNPSPGPPMSFSRFFWPPEKSCLLPQTQGKTYDCAEAFTCLCTFQAVLSGTMCAKATRTI